MTARIDAVQAIVFDTLGTLVDWRGSIVRDLSAWGAAERIDADWARLAELWRGRYQPQMERVRSGARPWTRLDDLHDESLRELLPQLGIAPLSDAQRRHVNLVWHRLDPWPDVVAGLERLKRRYLIAPLSNGNIRLLVDLARHGGLPWDVIFSAEHFEHYKPQPEAYLGACRQLDLRPDQVMMCAAHNGDLRAARAAGLQTAFIARPTEYGPGQTTDLAAEAEWEVIAADVEQLAERLGCPG
jgi:2-haloacid dehalogenase